MVLHGGRTALDGSLSTTRLDWQTNNMALNQVFGKKSLRTSGFSSCQSRLGAFADKAATMATMATIMKNAARRRILDPSHQAF